MTTKRQATFAILLSCTLTAAAQTSAPPVKDDLFAGTEKFAQGASSVTQIDMDPESLGKVEGKDGLKARRTVLSVVHTYEYDKPGMYKIEDVDAFRKKLETGDWHCSVHIQQLKTGHSTDICNKRRTDELAEKAIITVEPKSLTFIHTIQHEGSWHGSEVFLPSQMGLFAPEAIAERAEMQANMAVARAEMQADMATMQPQLGSFYLDMKDFKGPDPEVLQRLQKQMKNFKGPDPEQMQHLFKDVHPNFGFPEKEAPPTPQP